VQYFCDSLHKISQQILVKHSNVTFNVKIRLHFGIFEFHKVV